MTVVAGYARDGVVTMAADSSTNYQGTEILGPRKIRRHAIGDTEALIACEGNGGILGVLLREWQPSVAPDPHDELEVLDWANEAATVITGILADQNPPLLDHEGATASIDGAVLIGWAGRLIYVFTHQAAVVPTGIAALGVGSDTVIGALHASARRDPKRRVAQAVELACMYHPGCRLGPDGPQVEQLDTTT